MKYKLLIVFGALLLWWSTAAVRMTATATDTGARISQNQFQQIEPGMPVEKLLELIDSPPKEHTTSKGKNGVSETLYWRNGRDFIRVKLINGKVDQKMSNY